VPYSRRSGPFPVYRDAMSACSQSLAMARACCSSVTGFGASRYGALGAPLDELVAAVVHSLSSASSAGLAAEPPLSVYRDAPNPC